MSNTLVPAIRTQFAHTHALRPSHTRANTQATHTRRVELVIHTALTRIRQFLIHVLFLFLSFYSLSLEYSFFFFFFGVRITAWRANFRFRLSSVTSADFSRLTLLPRWTEIGLESTSNPSISSACYIFVRVHVQVSETQEIIWIRNL